MNLPWLIQEWIIPIAVALGTVAAAWAAWAAARASQRASEGALFSSLMEQYSSLEMRDALRVLAHWPKSGPSGYQMTPRRGVPIEFAHAVRRWAQSTENEALKYDAHRRLVAHFFSLAALLIKHKHISDDLADELKRLPGTRVLWEVVAPMERAWHESQGTPSSVVKERLELWRDVYFPGQGIPTLPPPHLG